MPTSAVPPRAFSPQLAIWLLTAVFAAGAAAAPDETTAARQPNVLVWMLDDVGFAQLSSYGGLVETPNIDRLAASGLRYANFHTTPICSASRAALLGGRNSHSLHIGGHAAAARPFPGWDARIPPSAGTVADNLKQAGYRTFALGKWDHLPSEEASPAGPFNQWPAGQGFDRFYGFLAADADNWNPVLIRGLTPVARPDTPDYHLNDDLADEAIAMITSRDATAPRAPFFMYWATGTAHAPHHAPKAWIERYSGRFDMGWDEARERILSAQKAQGLIPASAVLAPRPEGMPPWDSLDDEAKKLYARQMEVFAAALSHADEQFGRILDALQAKGELDDTLVIVTSDNGASAEGIYHGLYNEAFLGSGLRASVVDNMRFYEDWGGPATFPHYSFGWAVAGNTPFRYYKQTAHAGGIRVPLVVSWPAGIAARGELRQQFVHVSDVAPTIMDLASVPLAATVNNVPQQPMEGLSFRYSITEPDAADRKQAQYFEMYGNKSLWAQGWTIATTHRVQTWEIDQDRPIDEPWELYDVRKDPGQTTDLAAQYPDKVAALDRLFDEQAERYNVKPIGNMVEGKREALRKGSQALALRKGKWRYAAPISNVPAFVAPPVHAVSYTLRARLELRESGVTGPIFAYGGGLGGVGFYLKEGRPAVILNTLAGDSSELVAARALQPGTTELELSFTNSRTSPDHDIVVRADGEEIASGRLQLAMPITFGIPETFDIGVDHGSTVLHGAQSGLPFPGKLSNIEFDFTEGLKAMFSKPKPAAP